MKKIFHIILVLFILLFLALFIAHTDLQQVLNSIGNIGWNFLWLLLITFFAYFIGTIGWYYCIGKQKGKVSITRLFVIRLVGESVSIFNPTSIVGGDYLKIVLLKPTGIKEKSIVSAVLLSRILMVITQIILFSIAVLLVYFGTKNPMTKQLLNIVLVLLISAIIGIPFLTLIGIKGYRRWFMLPSHIQQRVSHLKFAYQTDKKNLLKASLHFGLHWFLGAMEFYFILYFLHFPIPIAESLLMDMGVIFFKSAGIFIPAQLGVEEYGNKVMLTLVGITSPGIWLSVSILRRARQLCWIAIGGLCYLFLWKKTFSLTSAA